MKLFAQSGYEAVRAAAVDMFPGTANVESVVRLEPVHGAKKKDI